MPINYFCLIYNIEEFACACIYEIPVSARLQNKILATPIIVNNKHRSMKSSTLATLDIA